LRNAGALRPGQAGADKEPGVSRPRAHQHYHVAIPLSRFLNIQSTPADGPLDQMQNLQLDISYYRA
jgi:hypothetical protein